MQIISEKFDNSKKIKYLGHLVFALMTFFAGVFYLQRMLFVDPSFITYSILEKGGYAVQVYRFGVVLTQSVPLLAHYMGASLKTILFCYSLTFPLFYWLIYTLLAHVFKAERAAMALVFIFTLMAYDSFYWIVAEYHQGMAMLVLLWAWLRHSFLSREASSGPQGWELGLQVVFMIFILFYHPLIIFPLLFALAFLWLDLPNKKHPLFLVLGISAIVLFAAKTILFPNPYDGNKIGAALKGLLALFQEGNWGYLKLFAKYCLYDYAFFTLSCIAIAALYLRQKQYLRLFVVGGIIVGYVLIICFTYPVDTPKVYMDGVFFALGFMVALPLLYDLLPALTHFRKQAAIIVIVGILAIRLPMIFLHNQPYSERLTWISNLVATMRKHPETDRFFVDKAFVPMDKLMYDWGIFYEVLFYSSLESPDSARTAILIPNPSIANWGHANKIINEGETEWIHCPWGGLSIQQQPFYKRYARLGNFSYKELPKDEIPK